MQFLRKIPVNQLSKLSELYKVDWPLHITTYSTIRLFIDRFKNHPQWINKVDFLSFKDDWRTHGAFIMLHENRIFFNTLEPFPFNNLQRALCLLQFNEILTFVNIRDALRLVVEDVIRIQHLEVLSDIGTKCFRLLKEDLNQLTIEYV